MKILMILEHFPPYIGGAEKLFGMLAKSYAEAGHEVKVLTTLFDPSLPGYEKKDGIEIFRIDCKNRYRFSLEAIPPAVKYAKWADVIHSSTYNALFPAWWASKKTSTPILVTVHEVWGQQWFEMPFISAFQKLAYYSFEKMVLNLGADKYVAVSESTHKQLLAFGVSFAKISTIYNGLEHIEPHDQWRAHGKNSFLFFGRLGVSKGLDIILEACHLMVESNISFTGKLVLSRKPKKIYRQIQALIKNYRLEDFLTIEHELTEQDLRDRMLNADCVLVPSRAEGFGFAAVEANQLGVPVVHSGHGALSETVSGKFIKMESYSPQSLVDSMQKVWKGEWESSELKSFPVKPMVEQYLTELSGLHKKSPS